MTPSPENLRQCATCQQEHPLVLFASKGRGRFDRHCKPCAANRKNLFRRQSKLQKSHDEIGIGRPCEDIELKLKVMVSDDFYIGLQEILELICQDILAHAGTDNGREE